MGIDRYFEDENRERNKVRKKQNKEIEDLKARNAELLEACKLCVEVMDIKHVLSSCPTENCEVCAVVESMKVAIAKAEGDSSG